MLDRGPGKGNPGNDIGIIPHATTQHFDRPLTSGFSHMLSTSVLTGQPLMQSGVT